MVRLTNKKIWGIIRRTVDGEKTNEQIAAAMKITPRWVLAVILGIWGNRHYLQAK